MQFEALISIVQLPNSDSDENDLGLEIHRLAELLITPQVLYAPECLVYPSNYMDRQGNLKDKQYSQTFWSMQGLLGNCKLSQLAVNFLPVTNDCISYDGDSNFE